MRCKGHFANDRICDLCYDTNNEIYNKCRKQTGEYKQDKEKEIILGFISNNCINAVEYYAEGSDRVGCKLDYEDGYYGNCIPFEEGCSLVNK